jgi:hypothetical protein
MHDPQNPSRIENSHPYKTPGERVHDWRGRVHDATTNSPSPMRDGSAEPAKCKPRGFMVPGRGVHDCCTAAVIAGPAQIELTAARSSVRSPAPSTQRTSGELTAAELRPECRALLGIALHSPFLTWWGRYSITSISQQALDITGARCPRRSLPYGMRPQHPVRTGKKDREPAGLAVSSESATIMKVAARHEADSKIDEQLHCSWRRCRWPRCGPIPEFYSGSLRWPIGSNQ